MPTLTAFCPCLAVWLLLATAGCASLPTPTPPRDPSNLNAVAESYIKLVLAVGRHDGNYVDSYYGPAEWRQAAAQGPAIAIADLGSRSLRLLADLDQAAPSPRRDFLRKQVIAVEAFLRRLAGENMSLDQEARLLYDIAPVAKDLAFFKKARQKVEALLPGPGDLPSRVRKYRQRFVIPLAKLDHVFALILTDSRRRTRALCSLPAGENFRHELVTDKSWGGYNWYQGHLQSLIQINTDLPKEMLPLLRTVVHEGYPGHHTFNVLLEDRLVRARQWREHTIYPLYSPQSLIAEGTANAGIAVVYPREQLLAFLTETLAPAAGLGDQDLDHYLQVEEALRPMRYASAHAARMLLDQAQGEEEVVDFLMRYGMYSEKRARKSLAFIRTYRSYIFNYTAGEDLVQSYLDQQTQPIQAFFGLLQEPVTPTQLQP